MVVALEVLLKMRVGVVLWNMRVWVGIRIVRIGFGEVVLGRVGYGTLGWVFDFSISCTFKRQIKYLSK